MKRVVMIGTLCAVLAGCGLIPQRQGDDVSENPNDGISSDIQIRPQARPTVLNVPPPASNARTAEAFDTTTKVQRDAAAEAPRDSAERALGSTVATLGTPTEPGFWLKTPLVTEEMPGRVVVPGNGASAQVTLIPIEGAQGAGSRLSLPAMRLLGLPLTSLSEVDVFASG